MHDTPNCAKNRNDIVYTPLLLAKKIIDHFNPSGIILDPASGNGSFYEQFPGNNNDWCEIDKGKDFFEYQKKVDWIITNPPWSKIREFLKHGYEIANNIVYLITINHVFTKARLRDMRDANFGIKEIFCFDTPPNFPGSGFQCGAVHFKRNYIGQTTISFDKSL